MRLAQLPVAAAVMFAALSAHAVTVTPGMTLNFEAGNETVGNNKWETTTATTGYDWGFGGNRTPVAVADLGRPGIPQAYVFPSAKGSAPTYSSTPLDADTQDGSFEVWFKPDDLVGKHVLFETGGNGSGASLVLEGTTLTFTVQTGTTVRLQASRDLHAGQIGAFNQVVGVFERDRNSPGSAIDLYLNGRQVASSGFSGTISSWAGGDTTGLGAVGGNSVAGTDNSQLGTFSDFNGQIAVNRFYQNKSLVATEALDNFAVVTGLTVDALTLNWDAAAPGNSPSTAWKPNIDVEPAALDWTLAGGADVPTLVPTVTTAHPGLTAAYEFKGGGGSAAGTTTLDGLTGNHTSQNASFELWVKPDDLSGQEVLLDLGGSGSGTTFALDGNILRFLSQTSSSANHLETSTVLASGAPADFLQIVGTVDLVNDSLALYVNGALRDIVTGGANLSSWAGTNGDAVGSINSNTPNINGVPSTSYGTFDGQIAIVRYYRNKLLSPDEVVANFQAVGVPEPATLSLLGLGALALLRRRRWK